MPTAKGYMTLEEITAALAGANVLAVWPHTPCAKCGSDRAPRRVHTGRVYCISSSQCRRRQRSTK